MEEFELVVDTETVRGHLYYPPKRPVGAVLWVHGFGSASGEFGDAPEIMAKAGFVVATFDQRGFGRSDGERGFLTNDRVQADIAAVTNLLQEKCNGPFGILGHSLGAYHALPTLQSTARVGVLVQPVHHLLDLVPASIVWRQLAKLGQRQLARGKGRKIPTPTWPSHLFVDKERAKWSDMETWHAKQIDMRCGDLALRMDGLASAKTVRKQVLIVGSMNDKRVPWKHSQMYLDHLEGPTEVFMHAGGHSCFRDIDGDQVIGRINDYFLQQWSGQ